jgi:hypothetical protein
LVDATAFVGKAFLVKEPLWSPRTERLTDLRACMELNLEFAALMILSNLFIWSIVQIW